MSGPSIYFLLSSDQNEETGNFSVYVGETENFSDRIVNHKSTSWWDKFVCFTSNDGSLTKAHVKYLEKMFFQSLNNSELAVNVENSQPPGGAKLPNSDECFLDGFSENMYFILRTMGIDYFEEPNLPSSEDVSNMRMFPSEYRDYSLLNGERFELKIPKQSAIAKMRVEDGKCILEKGSYLSNKARSSFYQTSYFKKWEDLINSHKVTESDIEGLKILSVDIIMESPSATAAVSWGACANGPRVWRNQTTCKSFKEMQKEVI